ncbi:glycosyltransferase family 2 protein [Psychrobacter sp. HII-4]|uniref:glycosyltransferase family 2 protein n=1 Tax=Psychrobacter sp. HII-4 TaxID=1569264 RepID=UPI0019182250|nr:glycosyltransferase family 2 protein [Psychrobacter sp. HII-4]
MTAKRRWYAGRLGLHRTILQHAAWLPVKTPRQTVVSTIAHIKRQNFTDDMAKNHIEHILYHKRYRQFHHELIKEIISFYPKVVFDFLKGQKEKSGTLDSSYYQGLYIALLQQHDPLSTHIDHYLSAFLAYPVDAEYADKSCLYSNIALHTPLAKLANLNQMLTHHQLDRIALSDEQQQFMVTNLSVIEQLNEQKKSQDNNHLHKVTVIVTTYNASETIESCIHSLLMQTWHNLEIIVVDDASTDDTLQRLRSLNSRYKDLTVIALPKNVGTFAAKSIGAQYATGEFLTCQDSDDWAHPQKIAEQVQPLITDARVMVTTSHWLRLDHEGQYYVRQVYPFMRQNPASPMFRLQTVKQETGLWHIVRTGADSEFFERLKLVYGNERIVVVKKPLTIASHRPNSLMTSEQFGIYNRTAALFRLDYWEAWRLWHIDKLHQKTSLTMPSVEKQANATHALFDGIPDSIKVEMLSLKESLDAHTVLSKL